MATKPHAFVVMPFGSKPGPDGKIIDFNRVYADYIKLALEAAGLEPFRADQEMRGGDIRTDMFQELLVADLVVADLTIDNPNVWYELGVRHALRARGVVLICGGKVTTAFDIFTDRKLRYGLKDGAPDPATLEDDKHSLTTMVKETMESWHGRKVSPVYSLMPNLQEPDWKSLRIGDVREFWEQHDAWEGRIDLARKAGRIGDLLVLAGEAPVAAFRAEAWIKAGEALRKTKGFEFALEHLDRGLEIEPRHLKGLQEKGVCLQRLALMGVPGHSLDRAREHYQDALKVYPVDPETWALLGRVDKDAWTEAWRRPGRAPEQMRDDARYEDALLRAAIGNYAKGYRAKPSHYYSGINALTLMHLFRHLTGNAGYDRDLATMAGAVRFAAECETDPGQLFWSKATLGDLEVLVGTPDTVTAAYKEAIARAENDWFALDSSGAQLHLLQDLGFRPDTVEAGIVTFARALERLTKPADRWEPRQVLLFSGHMIDAPGRSEPRFPADKEPIAARAIRDRLEQLGAGPTDLALCGGACGGDLLFAEACLERGVRLELRIPFPEPQFLEKSVTFAGEGWRDRFYTVKRNSLSQLFVIPDELGQTPRTGNPYERDNLWQLYSALARGPDKVRFICLWNRKGSDGPGGTRHMHDSVKSRSGQVHVLDTNVLW